MIRSAQIDEASFGVRLKAKACECHEVDERTVYVIPHDRTKDRRAVIWLLEGILCVSATTGEPCEANDHRKYCYHAVAANRRREINAKRRATLNRKKLRAQAA